MGLGNAIRSLRKKRGMTQGDLAQATGFSLDSISRWEREERSPVADDLRKLALVLNTTVGFLMGEVSHSQPLSADEKMTMGKEIRQRREKKGWTQQVLAEKVGITGAFLSEIETGKKRPSYETLSALATVFNCSAGDLLNLESEEVRIEKQAIKKQADEKVEREIPGVAWWGSIVDHARDVADRGDAKEIALIEPLLRAALEALEVAKVGADMDRRPWRSERPLDDGVVKSA